MKWSRLKNDVCPFCGESESVIHVYFDCIRIKTIWDKMSRIVSTRIKWKNIIIGYTENNIYHTCRNLVISVILYSLYKFWISGLEDQESYIKQHVEKIVKHDIKTWLYIMENKNCTWYKNCHNYIVHILKKIVSKI